MLIDTLPSLSAQREIIARHHRMDETTCVTALLVQAKLTDAALERIGLTAKRLVTSLRKKREKQDGIDALLQQYDLSQDESIALMCLAEALLRIPDAETKDKLIQDKIGTGDWESQLGTSDSLFVNAATWSLMLTGKIYAPEHHNASFLKSTLKQLWTRLGSTLARPLITQGMKILGKQFVMGQTIKKALKRAEKMEAKGYRFSFDMLGEAARTEQDAKHYYAAYVNAIETIGQSRAHLDPITGPGISVKLSALHPRYEYTQHDRILQELTPRVLSLAQLAKAKNIGLTIDAEEADRLELFCDVYERVFCDASLDGWEGLGLALQAYQKRAYPMIDWLAELSKRTKRRMMLRLIKGAYWDSEIKYSQLLGVENYPVFTRKASTDVSYIACAKKILSYTEAFYPQFGTHNAYSTAVILELLGDRKDFEFQCLHGMGRPLYDQLVGDTKNPIACRIYAPVGSHEDLLGYLVRRLLENGANTSFVNRLADEKAPIEKIIADPVAKIAALQQIPHPHIPLPENLFGNTRKNSRGLDLSNGQTLRDFKQILDTANAKRWQAMPLLGESKEHRNDQSKSVYSPSNTARIIGTVCEASLDDTEKALSIAVKAKQSWQQTTVDTRAKILEKAADLLESSIGELVTMLALEGGRQILDGISEVREAVDFCRYYAMLAREQLAPMVLPGPTGESNILSMHPRGIFICISPWNFPVAIFLGQITAALVTGNVVIAKPAEQTPLIATKVTEILHAAGVPRAVLQLLPGRGETIGAKLVADESIAGVMFTGSTEVAHIIDQTLAKRRGPLAPLIAETGGLNAMIVDSSSLPEQVTMDAIYSAFNSAGQRCSSLRVLYVQEEIADKLLKMLSGAMAELVVGDPGELNTDVGPVIDQDALQMLNQHSERMHREAKFIYQAPTAKLLAGNYFAPRIFELPNLALLQREVFGPILHVIRYQSQDLNKVLAEISATQYGLTLGIHSRIDSTARYIAAHMSVGNIYINRNMIGAVVGVQPFGGEGLSGTGPKAGGPHYLHSLCVERCTSINTTAAGGNASLVTLGEE